MYKQGHRDLGSCAYMEHQHLHWELQKCIFYFEKHTIIPLNLVKNYMIQRSVIVRLSAAQGAAQPLSLICCRKCSVNREIASVDKIINQCRLVNIHISVLDNLLKRLYSYRVLHTQHSLFWRKVSKKASQLPHFLCLIMLMEVSVAGMLFYFY